MTLSQFLLPGETILYESGGEVYYGRKPYVLYVTGERLLLYAAGGRLGAGERAVTEPLSAVNFIEYSEGGWLSRRGRLDIRFVNHTLSLTGSPGTIKEVWQALQGHTLQPPRADAEELTLVAPPPPLFDDQTHAPAQVQPLSEVRPRPSRVPRGATVVVAIVCLAALVALAALLFGRRAWPPGTPPSARPDNTVAAAATPSPSPTPVRLQVMDEVFKLDEGSHRAIGFTVPAGGGTARVTGGFRVTSGSYVDFYLMSREQYDRFAVGGSADITSVVYREEQWNARVGERLSAGDYYLVFDNQESETGEQTVAAEFFLVFDEGATTH